MRTNVYFVLDIEQIFVYDNGKNICFDRRRKTGGRIYEKENGYCLQD